MAKKIGKGIEITELVKGSLEYTQNEMRDDFRMQFQLPDPQYGGMTCPFWIVDTFADYVVVSGGNELAPDEYYKVTYTLDNGTKTYVFAMQGQWETVELSYQPQTPLSPNTATSPQIGENAQFRGRKKGKKFEERLSGCVLLEENEAGKARRIKINAAITAGVVNGNHRRYPAHVIEAAVAELRGHLNESAGQGRAVQVLGEAEHPSDKGGRPNLLETVTKWEEVSFNGSQVDVMGRILETSKGKDILTLMEGGVMPGVSLRGYGEGKNVTQNGEKIFEVSELHITGFDLVLEPSFENSAQLIESIQGEIEMNEMLEQLKKLLAEQPELFGKGMTEAQLEALSEKQLKKLDESLRAALGIDGNANIIEAVKGNAEKARKFDESERKSIVDAAITESTKELPYGKEGNEAFVESVKAANLSDATAVKAFVESKRKEYDRLYSRKALGAKGFVSGKPNVQVVGPVLETEAGVPEFARAAFDITESIRKYENRSKRTIELRDESPASIFSQRLLERFDELYGRFLIAESKALEEAETTSDLNLPYSVARALILEAFPDLVAANIFDVGVINTSPTLLYFERTTGESGYTATITDEVEAAGAENSWYDLAHGRITPDTVVVTSNPAGTTYEEGVDYIIDYAAGRIKPLTPGSIGSNDLLVDYQYTAIRDGEMQPIQRAKSTLDSMTIKAAADRLADEISTEAILFSQSQIGWDARGRTMTNLIKQVRRKIDQGLLYMAFSAVKAVANNKTDPWTIGTEQADYAELVRLMGDANVIVENRFYEVTYYLMSKTNANRLSNWDGFQRTGFPNAFLNASGFAGMVKNKPIFASTEFPDSLIIAGNRELVAHRVYNPMTIKGPFPIYAASGDTTKLVAGEQYYAEEFNVTESPVYEKGAYVPIEEPAS